MWSFDSLLIGVSSFEISIKTACSTSVSVFDCEIERLQLSLRIDCGSRPSLGCSDSTSASYFSFIVSNLSRSFD